MIKFLFSRFSRKLIVKNVFDYDYEFVLYYMNMKLKGKKKTNRVIKTSIYQMRLEYFFLEP